MPTPALMRDKCVHIRLSRGSEYSSCASSTARRASCVCARVEKISRITSVRSSTLTPSARSKLRIWAGERLLSKIDRVGIGGADHQFELLDLALAEISRLIGGLRAFG